MNRPGGENEEGNCMGGEGDERPSLSFPDPLGPKSPPERGLMSNLRENGIFDTPPPSDCLSPAPREPRPRLNSGEADCDGRAGHRIAVRWRVRQYFFRVSSGHELLEVLTSRWFKLAQI